MERLWQQASTSSHNQVRHHQMRSLLSSLVDGICEDLGHPAGLCRVLAQHVNLRATLVPPTPCISAGTVVPWHELGEHPVLHWPRRDHGELLGWKATSGSHYDSFYLRRPEYAQLSDEEIIDDWTCDISEVHGFSASKSDLCKFTSTDQMVETNSREMISEISPAKLAKNLAHDEIRILHREETSDHFARYSWDGRLWLMNSGGSHHLAAAKYIACRLGIAVPLRARLNIYSLNAAPLAALQHDFEMFVISSDAECLNAFHDAMRAFKATWLWHHMPKPYDNARAILLPRTEGRSRRVADELRRANFTDLGAYLIGLLAGGAQRPSKATSTVSGTSIR